MSQRKVELYVYIRVRTSGGSATIMLFRSPFEQLAMAVHPSINAPAAFLLLLVLASAGLVESLSAVGRVRLKLGFGKALREDAVARYFEGG